MPLRAGLPARLALALLLGAPGARAAAQAPDSLQRRQLDVAGVRRSYALFLPPSRGGGPLPLILVFHAAGAHGAGMARHTGFDRLAGREGFAVAYPEGLNRRWNDGRGGSGRGADDVGFVRALLDTLAREIGLDTGRIYATGISNGGMFVHRLACELPGTLAAIAPVAAALPVAVAERCAGALPVALLAFQGTADPFVPYAGGGATRRTGPVLSAARSAAFWARVNGCAATPEDGGVTDTVTDGTRVRRQSYPGCRTGRSVVLYTIEGGGHTWPGGPAAASRVGRASREVDATEVIWDFFRRHARP